MAVSLLTYRWVCYDDINGKVLELTWRKVLLDRIVRRLGYLEEIVSSNIVRTLCNMDWKPSTILNSLTQDAIILDGALELLQGVERLWFRQLQLGLPDDVHVVLNVPSPPLAVFRRVCVERGDFVLDVIGSPGADDLDVSESWWTCSVYKSPGDA